MTSVYFCTCTIVEWLCVFKEEKYFTIIINPVRKVFVEKPEHWKYSSARNWILDDDSIIKINHDMIRG